MAAQKACGQDNLWTVGWIASKFGRVVLWVFLMIWLTFGINPLKTKWLPQPLKIQGGIIFSLFSLYIMEWSWTDLEISTLLKQCHLTLCRHCWTLLTFVSGLDNNAVVKNQVSGNSPSTKPMEVVSEFFRCRQSWSLSGPGKLPTPQVGKLPLSTGDPNLSSL